MNFFRRLIDKILSSFDNDSVGFSARKLSAFVGVSISVYATVHYVNGATVIDALKVWLIFALLCLGIITIEQLIKLKNGSSESSKEDKKSSDNLEEPK